MTSNSDLEQTFDTFWLQLAPEGIPEPQGEYRFDPARRYRFDRAWPEQKLAVELEGGVWSGGRHTTGAGFVADCRKYNHAAEMGWLVLRYTSDMLNDDPMSVIEQIVRIWSGRKS